MEASEQEVISRFKNSYVTVSEIAVTLGVTKGAVTKAISRGDLPRPAFVSCRFAVWERPNVEPYIKKWIDKSRSL